MAEEKEQPMFVYWNVRILIRDRIFGGVPKSPEVIEGWIKARTGLEGDTLETVVIRTKKEAGVDTLTDDEIEALARLSWNGFKSDTDGLYVDNYQMKALIKESAAVLNRKAQIWRFKSYIAERVHVKPLHLSLGIMEPTGFVERPINFETQFGEKQSALKRSDFVSTPQIEFQLKVLNDKIPVKGKQPIGPDSYLPMLFEMAEELGLGADRGMGFGQFDLIDLEQVE